MSKQASFEVRAIKGVGEVNDGQAAGLMITDANNADVVLAIPHQMEGQFLLALHAASRTAAAKRGGSVDPKLAHALEILGFQARQAKSGDVALQYEFPGGLKLAMVLNVEQQRALREALDKAEKNHPKPN